MKNSRPIDFPNRIPKMIEGTCPFSRKVDKFFNQLAKLYQGKLPNRLRKAFRRHYLLQVPETITIHKTMQLPKDTCEADLVAFKLLTDQKGL